jgi:hypothetical protein
LLLLLLLLLLQVATAGRYLVQIMYTSQIQASFRLSVGPYSRILDGDALAVTARIPAAVSDSTGCCVCAHVCCALSWAFYACKLSRGSCEQT